MYSFTHSVIELRFPVDGNAPELRSLVTVSPRQLKEREIWDLFGFRFTGHPIAPNRDAYEWEGHQLRKDYRWLREVQFSLTKNRLTVTSV
jgi:NADH-quinone oxidoreductase subunit C/D